MSSEVTRDAVHVDAASAEAHESTLAALLDEITFHSEEDEVKDANTTSTPESVSSVASTTFSSSPSGVPVTSKRSRQDGSQPQWDVTHIVKEIGSFHEQNQYMMSTTWPYALEKLDLTRSNLCAATYDDVELSPSENGSESGFSGYMWNEGGKKKSETFTKAMRDFSKLHSRSTCGHSHCPNCRLGQGKNSDDKIKDANTTSTPESVSSVASTTFSSSFPGVPVTSKHSREDGSQPQWDVTHIVKATSEFREQHQYMMSTTWPHPIEKLDLTDNNRCAKTYDYVQLSPSENGSESGFSGYMWKKGNNEGGVEMSEAFTSAMLDFSTSQSTSTCRHPHCPNCRQTSEST